MLTLMGIAARRLNVDIKGMHAKVTKEMAAAPVRRISKIRILFSSSQTLPEEVIAKLIHAAETCPVHKSLHPDIVLDISYRWGPQV
jgi:putative redox protein